LVETKAATNTAEQNLQDAQDAIKTPKEYTDTVAAYEAELKTLNYNSPRFRAVVGELRRLESAEGARAAAAKIKLSNAKGAYDTAKDNEAKVRADDKLAYEEYLAKTRADAKQAADEAQEIRDAEAKVKADADAIAAIKDDVAGVSNSVDALAEELGLTKEELLETIGQTEEDLLTAIGETGTELSGEIDTIAAIIGKPASEVTDADINFVTDIIAQQEALTDPTTFELTEEQLGYDVNGDGVVDIQDQQLLQGVMSGDQALDIALDNKFAATGVFKSQLEIQQELEQQLEQQQQQQLEQQQQLQQQMETQAKKESARDFINALAVAEDGKVDVKASPLFKSNPAYDFNSIFANPQQAGMAISPYGTPTPRPNPAAGPVSTSPFGMPRRAKGGIINTNEELLRLIGDM